MGRYEGGVKGKYTNLPVEMVVYGIEDMKGGGKGNNTNIT